MITQSHGDTEVRALTVMNFIGFCLEFVERTLVRYGQQEKTGRVYVRTKVRSTASVNVPLLSARYWILLSPHSQRVFNTLCLSAFV